MNGLVCETFESAYPDVLSIFKSETIHYSPVLLVRSAAACDPSNPHGYLGKSYLNP